MKYALTTAYAVTIALVSTLLLGTLILSGCNRASHYVDDDLIEDYSDKIAAGWRHSLAVMDNGAVVAWVTAVGNREGNIAGQVDVPSGLSGVKSVAAGRNFSLALKHDGELIVWGGISQPEETQGFISIAAGDRHAIALRQDGTVYAWGRDDVGQLRVPANLKNVVAISAGFGHSLAVTEAGEVIAWGDNGAGQCNVPKISGRVVQVSAGLQHSLARTNQGDVIAWGANDRRQSDVPESLSGNVRSIAANWWASYAVHTDGRITAWGYGSLMNPSYSSQLLPSHIEPAMGIAANETHVIYVSKDGSVHQWASDRTTGNVAKVGQAPVGLKVKGESLHTTLGATITSPRLLALTSGSRIVLRADGTLINWGAPLYIRPDIGPVVDISGNRLHQLALTEDGRIHLLDQSRDPASQTLVTMYAYTRGEVIAGSMLNFTLPERLPSATRVAASINGAIALTRDGKVVQWSYVVPLLRSSQARPEQPVSHEVVGLWDIVDISAGDYHYLALRRDGTLFAWGDNEFGQATIPPGGGKYVAISAWGDCSFAITTEGKLVAWGDGAKRNLDMPSDLAGVVAIAGAMALTDDGRVVAWGAGADRVPYIEDAVEITTISGSFGIGAYSGMALRQDGSIITWGTNSAGELNVPPGLRVR